MTQLTYLQNPDLFSANAKILEILKTENVVQIVLDQTIFYVQGGGQPSDTGIIKNMTAEFEVTKVFRDENGKILHSGNFTTGKFEIGQEAELIVDQAKRNLHSKIHSDGHLLDLAIQKSGLNWIPGKGFHFVVGSYVEYQIPKNTSQDLNLEDLKNTIQAHFDELVNQKLPFKISFDETQTFHGEPLRKIKIGNEIECPCGGTHAKNTSELAGFKITKIKLKSGIARVSYGLVDL
jgi:Ser-tRNA(Ala) deacylase AlaX